jgi:hypothetical protein
MAINYTSLLGLAQPVPGTEANTWGTVVNDEITALIEEAVAGGETIDVTSGNVTLTNTVGTANQARNAILVITGTPGTSRNIVAPSQSKAYMVVNGSNDAVVIKGSATSGVTLPAGTQAVVAWNGSDFVTIASNQQVYPGAGMAVSTGSAWGTSKTTPTGDVVGTTDTQTLSAKRINPRVVNASGTSGNLTINGDTTDLYKAEGLTGAITFLQPSGTPVDGQKLMIRIEDNGTARGITWTTSAGAFRAVGITLPTTTVLGKVTYVGCVYNSTDSFWDAVATVTQA